MIIIVSCNHQMLCDSVDYGVFMLPEDQSSLNAGLHFLCQVFHIGL